MYDLLSHIYAGWSLTEIKAMSVRERTWWVSFNRWRTDKTRPEVSLG